jgi:hypothetical protein
MTAIVKTNIAGIKDLERTFREMASDLSGVERAEICLAGAEVYADEVRHNIRAQGLVSSGDLLGSVEAFKVNQWTAGVSVGRGSDAAQYASALEYGVYDWPVTERQRAYFMAQYWKSGYTNKQWLWRALATTITITAKPYFRPAISAARQRAHEAMADRLLEILRRYEQ